MLKSKVRFYDLDQSPLYKCRTKARLAKALCLKPEELSLLLMQGLNYKEWDIEKPNGKSRHIENPTAQLKRVQKRIAKLLSRIGPPAMLFCPVKGRSYIKNAAHHLGEERIIHKLDIREFFPSASDNRIIWFWRTVMKCAPDVVYILKELTCFDGHLPTGAPSSPILSYYSHLDMWERMIEIAEKAKITISIYIDDITLSGPLIPRHVLQEIRSEITKTRLKYHKEKRSEGRSREVTGGILSTNGVTAPNRILKTMHEIRQELRTSPPEPQKAVLMRRLKSYQANLNQMAATKV